MKQDNQTKRKEYPCYSEISEVDYKLIDHLVCSEFEIISNSERTDIK